MHEHKHQNWEEAAPKQAAERDAQRTHNNPTQLILNTLKLIRILHNQSTTSAVPSECVILAPTTLAQVDEAIKAAETEAAKHQVLTIPLHRE